MTFTKEKLCRRLFHNANLLTKTNIKFKRLSRLECRKLSFVKSYCRNVFKKRGYFVKLIGSGCFSRSGIAFGSLTAFDSEWRIWPRMSWLLSSRSRSLVSWSLIWEIVNYTKITISATNFLQSIEPDQLVYYNLDYFLELDRLFNFILISYKSHQYENEYLPWY